MPKVVRNPWNPFSQFLFTDELGIMLSEIPNDRWYIVNPLMIGNKDARHICWDVMGAIHSKSCPQYIQAAHKEKIKHIYRGFMSFFPNKSEAEPLDSVKYHKG